MELRCFLSLFMMLDGAVVRSVLLLVWPVVELRASTDTVLTGIDNPDTVECSWYDARYLWLCFQHILSGS